MKSHPQSILATSIAAAAALLCLASPLHAADRFWIDSLGGSFSDLANWSATDGGAGGASVPVAADVANFTLNSTYTVTFSSAPTNLGLDVENGNVTLDLNGLTYTLTSGGAVFAGNVSGQTGRLTVRDGILAVDTNGDNVTVGVNAGGTGFLTVTTGGRIGDGTIRPNVTAGSAGTGTLTVNDNGRIDGAIFIVGNSSGVAGTATITGPNAAADFSGTTTVGNAGTGSVTVTNGGTLTSTSTATLGSSLGADGTVAVSGVGSSWTIGSTATIGSAGDGTLTVSAGGLVSATGGVVLGSAATGFGTATVTGAGSRWNLSAAQTIGSSGLGVMTVSSGGQVVSTSSANLGSGAGSQGRATVTGAGSQWTTGSSITVGSSGTGDLTVSGGGEVATSGVTLGGAATGIGVATITGAGSKLTTTSVLTVANLGTGTLNVSGGAEVYVGTNLSVFDPTGAAQVGTLNLDGGSIFVAGNFINNSVFNFTDGLLRVAGNFQPRGTVSAFTIDGTDIGDLPTVDLIAAGTTTNVAGLNVGSSHRGQLLLREGRVLNAGGAIAIANLVGSEGIVTVQSGAQLLTTTDFSVGGGGSAGGTGTLNIASGTVDAGTLRIFNGGTVTLSSGTLAVNTAPVLDGQLNWTGGTLRFDSALTLSSTTAPKLLGLAGTLGAGRALATSVGVSMTLDTPVIVDGGTLSAGQMTNNSTFEIRAGSANVSATIINSAGAQILTQRNLTLGTTLTNNAGARLELAGGTGQVLGAGSISNLGLITGDGTIAVTLNNFAGGEVRGEFGKTLAFTGTNGPNTGRVNLLGGTVSFAQQFTNSATGQINGQGALYFPTTPVPSSGSPTAGLMNSGNINLSGGDSQIYGTAQMLAGSRVIVSGGASATFFDVFRHSGLDVKASAGSAIVFFGEVRGAGSFSGPGTVFFEGGYSPGNSPAAVTLGTVTVFGSANTLTLELGGLNAGSQYDQLILGASGSLALDGALVLDLIDGFVPHFGDTFQVFAFAPGQVSGAFGAITVADPLTGGLSFDTSGLSTAGQITVVPEPGAMSLLAVALGMLASQRRPSRRRPALARSRSLT